MNFIKKDGEQIRTVKATKLSATVIAAGKLVGLNDGENISQATGTTAAVAYCEKGAPAGVTEVEVSVGNDFTLKGTAENVFANSQKGTEVDLVISGSDQLINNDASSTDVLKVDISNEAGVVGATTNVVVRINKPLF